MAVHCSQPRGWSATPSKSALGDAAAAPYRKAARRARRRPALSAAAAAPSAPEVQAATALLRTACTTKKVDPPQVVSALELVEAAHQSAPRVAPGFPGSLDGTWRLVFAVPAPIPAWAYIPVREDAEISVAAGTIDLVSFVGPLSFRFKGQCRFEAAAAGGKAEMHFAFQKMQVEAFGFKRESELSGKPKVYSFFLLEDGLAAANSSGTGGKTLMFRA